MIVLDSSFLIAYHNQRDHHHSTAHAIMQEFLAGKWGRGLLLEYVLLEVVTVVLLRRGLPAAVEVGRTLLRASELDLVPCSALFTDVWDAFQRQAGKPLSFADAAVLTVARQKAGGRLITFDTGFRGLTGLQLVGC